MALQQEGRLRQEMETARGSMAQSNRHNITLLTLQNLGQQCQPHNWDICVWVGEESQFMPYLCYEQARTGPVPTQLNFPQNWNPHHGGHWITSIYLITHFYIHSTVHRWHPNKSAWKVCIFRVGLVLRCGALLGRWHNHCSLLSFFLALPDLLMARPESPARECRCWKKPVL